MARAKPVNPNAPDNADLPEIPSGELGPSEASASLARDPLAVVLGHHRFGTAQQTKQGDGCEVTVKRWEVLEGKQVMSNGLMHQFNAGKVVSVPGYNVENLRRQGLKMRPLPDLDGNTLQELEPE